MSFLLCLVCVEVELSPSCPEVFFREDIKELRESLIVPLVREAIRVNHFFYVGSEVSV